jgi:hypothetical protein
MTSHAVVKIIGLPKADISSHVIALGRGDIAVGKKTGD